MTDWKTERRSVATAFGWAVTPLFADAFLRPVSYDAVVRALGDTTGKPCLHFVRFKDDRYLNAVKTFGRPDFIHRHWDQRAVDEIAPGDTVVFAEGDERDAVTPFSYDDSAFF